MLYQPQSPLFVLYTSLGVNVDIVKSPKTQLRFRIFGLRYDWTLTLTNILLYTIAVELHLKLKVLSTLAHRIEKMSATNEVSSTMDKTSLSPSQDTEVVKESAPRTPTAEMDVTKGENSVGNGGVSAGGEDNMQYPKGFILAALVGCVMMTVFLIALDQVST